MGAVNKYAESAALYHRAHRFGGAEVPPRRSPAGDHVRGDRKRRRPPSPLPLPNLPPAPRPSFFDQNCSENIGGGGGRGATLPGVSARLKNNSRSPPKKKTEKKGDEGDVKNHL